MQDDLDFSQHRNKLLEDFRQSLSKPLSERFFDEDDLVEIFDYAGDLSDDYLRMEVLMCGARYFPDSEALYQRRAIFYSQYSDAARDKFLEDSRITPYADGTPFGGLIIEAMRVRSENPKDEDADKQLDRIVDAYDNWSDEDVIQLIDLASSLNRFDWIKTNLTKLRSKVDYINVLLYEVAIAADNFHEPEYAISLLEELTELEPYNPYYWLFLAKQYALINDDNKALTAIDYSLAISPNDSEALLTKARICYSLDHDFDEIVTLLKQAISNNPQTTEACRMLANIYTNDGKPEIARDILLQALDNASPIQILEIVPELIILSPENVDQWLDLFYNNNEENTQLMWASWAQQLSFFGYPEVSRRVIKCFERNSGIPLPSLFSIEDSFVNKDFKGAINAICEYIKEIGAAESDFPAVAAMHLISLVRLKSFAEALEFCEFFENNIDISKYKTLSSRLEFVGLFNIIHNIKRLLKNHSDTYDWDKFDPLAYWTD